MIPSGLTRKAKISKAAPAIQSLLLHLPTELLIEIMVHLGWRDVLMVRRTCKTLHSTSKDRAIWVTLFKEVQSSSGFKLDYPAEKYTSGELERYALRALKSEIVWATDKPTTDIQRDISGEGMDRYWLSESGRWLLIMTSSGSVIYYDLDNEDVPGRTLIPNQGTDWHQSTRMAVDVDTTKPILTFNVALYLSSSLDESHFEIWRVHLQLYSNDERPGLIAEKLVSFSRDTGGLLCHISLLEKHIAYSICASRSFSAAVMIIDWTTVLSHSEGESQGYPRRVIFPLDGGAICMPLHLLPGNRLFAVSMYCVQLFDYIGVAEIQYDGMHSHNHVCTPWLWKTDMDDLKEFTLSRPYLCPAASSIRLLVSDLSRVLGFIIPLHKDDLSDTTVSPCVVKLMDYGRALDGRRWRACLGYRKGVTHCDSQDGKNSKVLALSYSWPDEENSPKSQVMEKKKAGKRLGLQLGWPWLATSDLNDESISGNNLVTCWLRRTYQDLMPPPSTAEFRSVLGSAKNIIILSGAGLSAPSGIQTYRGSGDKSLWSNPNVVKYSKHTTFEEDPSGSWQFYHHRRLGCLSAKPNKGHLALAALNLPSVASRVIPSASSAPLHVTQNLDELAVRAIKSLPKSASEGHKRLVQVHGSLFRTRCLSCKHETQNYELYVAASFKDLDPDVVVDIPVEKLPRCGGDEWSGSNRYGRCGGLLRPDVVWFGEVPPKMGEIAREITWCDLLIVVGTSSIVQPAAGFASQVQEHGGKVAIFNLEKSNNDDKADFLFLGSCDATLPEVLDVGSDIADFL